MSTKPVSLYDTTLRDGTQGTGISFSVLDKIRVAEKLDAFGIDYIEGGWPGSNPKDAAFFEEAAQREWKHAKIAAFGMTRRGRMKVEEDSQVQMLLAARTPVVTIVGKTWPLHVTEVFGVSLEENLSMIGDTVRFSQGARTRSLLRRRTLLRQLSRERGILARDHQGCA